MDKKRAQERWDKMQLRKKEIDGDKDISYADAKSELAEIADMEGLLKPILGIKEDKGEEPPPEKKKRSWL